MKGMSGTQLTFYPYLYPSADFQGRNLDDIEWSNGVRDLFLRQSSTPSPSAEPPRETSVPVGPIAGGVVGGAVVIALIAGLLWFLRRRHLTNHQPEINHVVSVPAEMLKTLSPDGKPNFQDPAAPDYRASDLHAADGIACVRYEVDGTSAVREMGTTNH